MTTPTIPGFIGDLFKKEIYKIQLDTVDRICQVYNLDKQEVLKRIQITDIKVDHPRLRIYWKHETEYGKKTSKPKCIAVLFKNKQLIRCPRSQVDDRDGCDFCKVHMKCFKEDRLPHGTIYDHDDIFNKDDLEDDEVEILEQCIARVYDKNERTLEQCSRCQKDASTPLCNIHNKMISLKYGTINDEIPKSVLRKTATKIY